MNSLLTIISILPLTGIAQKHLENDYCALSKLDYLKTNESHQEIIESLFNTYNDPWFFTREEAINYEDGKYTL